jgi:hypothetical protein
LLFVILVRMLNRSPSLTLFRESLSRFRGFAKLISVRLCVAVAHRVCLEIAKTPIEMPSPARPLGHTCRYQRYVETLDSLTHNNTEQIKNKALGAVFSLLLSKPEQERALLGTLCNKLGDPEKKVAAKVRGLFVCLFVCLLVGLGWHGGGNVWGAAACALFLPPVRVRARFTPA